MAVEARRGGDGRRRPRSSPRRRPGLQMSLEEMSAATGVERERIKELEWFGIVCSHGPEGASYYDGDDYIVLSIVKDFLRYGIEPRHLTMYKHFAERESAFFEAIVAPDAPPEEPGRAPRRRADARRSDRHLAEVQAGAAAPTCATTCRARDAPPSALGARLARRRGRHPRAVVALGLAPAQLAPPAADARAARRAALAVPAGARDAVATPRCAAGRRAPARSSPTSTRGRSCSRRRPTAAVRSRASRRS